jgi:DNA-binding transcriptional MerR regulator
MYHRQTEQTRKIHNHIITICHYLRNGYSTKKHGGYNIYSDSKIHAITDTCVPNVDLYVNIGESREYVFGCSYHGDQVTYHPGKWEDYLDELFDKATEAKQRLLEAQYKQIEQERLDCERAASEAADNVFSHR